MKLRILQHINKTPWLHVQQGKCPPINIQNFFFIYMCILVYIPDIVWMLKGTNRIIDITLITLTLNGVRPKQREKLVYSMIMISENAAPRNS